MRYLQSMDLFRYRGDQALGHTQAPSKVLREPRSREIARCAETVTESRCV